MNDSQKVLPDWLETGRTVRLPSHPGFLASVCFLLVCLTACNRSSSSKSDGKTSPPATVSKYAKEDELATITLTPEAEKRLGVVTVPIVMRKTERTRTFGGELIIPLGRMDQENTGSGSNTARSIYSLVPAMTPTDVIRVGELQIEADGQVAAAKVQLEGAKVALSRAENLLANKAGSIRTVDEAKVQVALAEAALRTAHSRRDLLGAPLFEAVNQSLLWVRVPVYTGDLEELNSTNTARVANLGSKPGAPTRPAKPKPAPISTAGAAAMVDLLYEIENTDAALKPGQKVAVLIPLKTEAESLVVPWAAVLHDIHGSSWVYEKIGAQTYARRRVQVRQVHDGLAQLASGPKPGAQIVTDGAAELFGTELGFGK